MQSPTWYIRRLRAMSPGEVAWRVKSSLRDRLDQLCVTRRQRLQPLAALLDGNADDTPPFTVTDVVPGLWASERASPLEHQWLQQLVARAERIVAHRLRLFDLEDHFLGDPIDWNRDHKADKPAPMTFAPSIDYRDVRVTGDCKFVWEPSRHQHLVVLGRAYRATGDVRYAAALIEQLESWLDQCPFGIGMQWRSPLELGIRLINWVWAMDLIRQTGLVAGEFRHRLLNAVFRQVWEVARKYSGGSSSNNHVVGEAAGIFVATSYFRNLKNASHWRRESRNRLCREIFSQTFSDGGGREQAVAYHLFVLQFFTIAGLVGRWTGDDFPPRYWRRLAKMFEFLGMLSEGGQHLPMFGDADDGYVLDLGHDPLNARQWLAVGAVLFDRADMAAWAGGTGEPARWLLGSSSQQRFEALTGEWGDVDIACRSLPETGYYLLQCGRGADRISVVFDCGELGLAPLASHGHADALSFVLRAFGVDVLVDPGTYDYFTYPRWREYFRSTRAHNTVVIDGQDQSVMQGPFLWGDRAQGRCLAWKPAGTAATVTGRHDGYRRLADPVTHCRTLVLDGRLRRLTIHDEIKAAGKHEVAACFHLAEQCQVDRLAPGRLRVDAGAGVVTMTMDPQLDVEVLAGGEQPIAGWVSRGYHRKTAGTTLVGRCRIDGDAALTCRIDIGR